MLIKYLFQSIASLPLYNESTLLSRCYLQYKKVVYLISLHYFFPTDALDETVYDFMRGLPTENVHSPKHAKLSMWSKTEALLRDFYAPFNEELAHMLNNADYLWKDL